LAKACLVVLNFDRENVTKDIEDLEDKISSHKRKIDFLSKPTQKGPRNVDIEKMSYAEIVREEERILQEMSIKVI
jgi:hypothetical protein